MLEKCKIPQSKRRVLQNIVYDSAVTVDKEKVEAEYTLQFLRLDED